MQALSQRQARQQAFWIVAAQFAIAGIVAVLFLIFGGGRSGLSAFVGGAINAIASYYQVRVAFSPRVFGDPRRMARAFYTAEVVKMAAIVALFSLAIVWLNLALLPTMIGFVATVFVFFAALLVPQSGNKHG